LTKIVIFKFKMADERHIENVVFGDSWAADCAIFAEVCTKIHDPRLMTGECDFSKFRNPGT